MKKFKCSPIEELLKKRVVNKIFKEKNIQTHQCHYNSLQFCEWLRDNGYKNVKFITCCLVDNNGNICLEFHHNVVRIGDKYYDITSEFNSRKYKDYQKNTNEYCVCGEFTISEYLYICLKFNMYISPFDYQYKDGKYYRYENTREIVVERNEYSQDRERLLNWIENY